MLTALMLLSLLVQSAPHDHDQAHRGAMVMGFDQDKTAHHFRLYTDGGAIEVTARDSSDAADRDAIRSHLPHIAMMFAEGNFDAPMLVHDSANVPGTAILAARKDVIRYRYEETRGGGRVSIITTDPEALAAVHDFLRYQITEHKTADPTAPQKR